VKAHLSKLAQPLCQKAMWEASPTPILRRNATCCEVLTHIGVRDPSYNLTLDHKSVPCKMTRATLK